MKLYEINRAVDDAVEWHLDNTEERRKALLENIPNVERAVEEMLKQFRNAEADAEKIDVEIKRLQGRKSACVNAAKKAREDIHWLLESNNIQKVRTPIGSCFKQSVPANWDIDERSAEKWPSDVFNAVCSRVVKVDKVTLKKWDEKQLRELEGVTYIPA